MRHWASLTHWGRMIHICVSNLTIIGSDNDLLPSQHQAIIWTNDGISLIGNFGTNSSEILIEILTFSFKKMRLKVSTAKWWPCCCGHNVLSLSTLSNTIHVSFENSVCYWRQFCLVHHVSTVAVRWTVWNQAIGSCLLTFWWTLDMITVW